MEPLATRSFTMADQLTFARLSGDTNPMHVDAAAARRTPAGSPAVHGVHAALWALEAMAGAGAPLDRLDALKVDFQRFLRLDAPVALTVSTRSDTRVRVAAIQDGASCLALEAGFGSDPPPDGAGAIGDATPIPATAQDRDLASLDGCRGRIARNDDAVALTAEWFPKLCAAVGVATVADVALLSTLVGMVAPGLHSVFSALRIDRAAPGAGPGLGYEVTRVDDRFRIATLDVSAAAFTGSVRAFVRFPPVAPAPIRDLAGLVGREEFAGRRALVVGGSRGIGAATAKLIAAGGGHVTLTYRSGEAEAQQIRTEIEAELGPGRCAIVQYDAALDPARQIAFEGHHQFTHVYFFATGRIFGHGRPSFDEDRFEGFAQVYVRAFVRLVEHLLEHRNAESRLHVLYPSSVAVGERPKGMTEYAMAKAAGEVLCVDLARVYPRLSISAPRLPRILTDQTATVPPVPAADPVEIMLPLMRADAG